MTPRNLALKSVAVLTLLAARSLGAATCPVLCAGAGPHDVLLADALTCAGAGGRVEIAGDCRLDRALAVNVAGVTLEGACGARLARNLPAPPPATQPSAAILLGAGASGTTIRGLTIAGAGNGIANSGGTAAVPASQPDGVRILDNVVRAGLEYDGAAIQHFATNGPPFNDSDACTGLPAGIATGWVIEGNDLASERGIGILYGGSGFRIATNRVRATLYGIAGFNNTKSQAAQPFGAPPSNHGNRVLGNVIEVRANADLGPGDIPVGLLDVGFPETPVAAPSPDRCDRGHSTAWIGNCARVTPDGLAGRDHGIALSLRGNGNALGSAVFERNSLEVDAPLQGTPSGNVGIETRGAKFARVERNDVDGAGDFPFLSLDGNAEGNLYRRNRVGPGVSEDEHFVHDFGVPASNCYDRNEYCRSHEPIEGTGADPACNDSNRADRTCGGLPLRCPRAPRAAGCATSASHGAPERASGTAEGEDVNDSSEDPGEDVEDVLDANAAEDGPRAGRALVAVPGRPSDARRRAASLPPPSLRVVSRYD